MSQTPELFHAINDSESARVRRWVVAEGMEQRIRFRNVTYDEVASELAAHGGVQTPALWASGRLVQGAEAVITALEMFKAAPAPERDEPDTAS